MADQQNIVQPDRRVTVRAHADQLMAEREAREAGTRETVVSAAKSRAKSDTATPYVTSRARQL
ncbi:hypothetical protein M1E17_09250 [Arthrobacter sp. D1-29]